MSFNSQKLKPLNHKQNANNVVLGIYAYKLRK